MRNLVRSSCALAVLAALASGACSLESEGEIEPTADASVAGAGGANGGSGGSAATGGSAWEDAQAGAGGVAAGGVGGSAGGGPCLADKQSCSSAGECCSTACGAGSDALDCTTTGECVACNDDMQCPTGRCDGCKCVEPDPPGGKCDEPSDCTTARCGFGTGADVLDCNQTDRCIECDEDLQCGSGRCDECACVAPLPFDASCDEGSDCQSGRCGADPQSSPQDCDSTNRCAECVFDNQCASNRCDGCRCLPQLPSEENCNEDSDCQSGDCEPWGECD